MRDMFAGDDDLLRRYLLGELSEEEEANVEDRLLLENRFSRRAELIEGELLAEYARGELTPAQRERIRLWSTSPGGRAKLALAQGLTEIAHQAVIPPVLLFPPPAPKPDRAPVWHRYVAALAACLLLAVAIPVGMQIADRNGERATETTSGIGGAPSPTPTPTPSPGPVQTPGTGPTPPPVQAQATPPAGVTERIASQVFALAFTSTMRSAGELEEGSTMRSGEKPEEDQPQVLSIKEESVDFQVQLDGAGEGPFEVTLTSGGEEAFQAESLELVTLDSGKRGIRFEVPAGDLPEGDCTITVQDTNAADTMPLIQSFEIRKQS